jgi:hypothetical protein
MGGLVGGKECKGVGARAGAIQGAGLITGGGGDNGDGSEAGVIGFGFGDGDDAGGIGFGTGGRDGAEVGVVASFDTTMAIFWL